MQKKSFLIIGHTGFIGQKLLEKSQKRKESKMNMNMMYLIIMIGLNI